MVYHLNRLVAADAGSSPGVHTSGWPLQTPRAVSTREAVPAVAPQERDRLEEAAAQLTPQLFLCRPSHLPLYLPPVPHPYLPSR